MNKKSKKKQEWLCDAIPRWVPWLCWMGGALLQGLKLDGSLASGIGRCLTLGGAFIVAMHALSRGSFFESKVLWGLAGIGLVLTPALIWVSPKAFHEGIIGLALMLMFYCGGALQNKVNKDRHE